MENTSKKNLEYQYRVILDGIHIQILNAKNQEFDPFEIDVENILECIEGIKEIQIALRTLTN